MRVDQHVHVTRCVCGDYPSTSMFCFARFFRVPCTGRQAGRQAGRQGTITVFLVEGLVFSVPGL